MNKILLLSKSHWRKNKGTSIGLVSLIFIAALLFSLSVIVLLDAYPIAQKEADRLDSGDGFMRLAMNIDGIDEEVIDEAIRDDVTRYYTYKGLDYITSVPFADGVMTVNVQLNDAATAFNKEMANSEIITEDTSITSDYVYLPYQFYTSGGFDIGDTFKLELQGNKYDLTVRGFLTTPYFGCNNCGTFEIVPDDETYAEIASSDVAQDCYVIIYELRDGVKESPFGIRTGNKFLAVNPHVNVSQTTLSVSLDNRTFISKIIVIAFMMLTGVVLAVVLLMLVNSISNYVKENMKTLGALKAIGYTSRDIDCSIIFLFAILSVIGSIVGICLSYALMPIFAKMVVAQMGIRYSASFLPIPLLMVFLSVVMFTVVVTSCALVKISNIDPIVALRDGTEGHSFRKNRIRLDKTTLGLDLSLALKTMLSNIKQNIITFIVVGIMVFLCVLGLLMYQNFNVKPKVDMLAFEYCSGVAAFDHETAEEARAFLESDPDVTNVRNILSPYFYYGDEDMLYMYITDNLDSMNNVNVCYEGRLPKYDNEIAISGKFAADYGFSVGDTIPMTYGDKTYDYLITGFIQTTNNGGKEGYLSMEAASRIIDLSSSPAYFYFDTFSEDSDNVNAILDRCEVEFGDHMISRMNFHELLAGGLTTFKMVATFMLITMCIVSVAVILLVMYLLVKSLVYNKRKDYGIFKAIGYTSDKLVLQTALSFMPSIVSAVLISSTLSYLHTNTFMNLIMTNFGVVKCNFFIPLRGVIMIAVAMIVVSFLLAVFESRKVKNIEAYTMLISE